MEQHGNTTTYNIETVLVQNIKSSPYYVRKGIDLETVHELIDEIYETVDNVEPWLSGNARGPSSAFCLLFRLGQLKPTAGDIREMIDHRDSPYIRAIGFLYLRYCCNPRELWRWCSRYMKDSEQFTPSPASLGKAITIGEFVTDILLDQYYFETIFPRIPKPVMDEFVSALQAQGLPTKPRGNAGQGGPDRRGNDDGGMRRPASVKASLSVALGQRAPNRAGAREVGRGMGSEHHNQHRHHQRRSPSPRGRRDDGRDRGDNRRRDRSRSWSRGRHNSNRGKERSRSRSRERNRGNHRDSDRYYGGSNRDRDQQYRGGRERSRERNYDRDRRSRSRSRDDGGGGGKGRDVRDVFRERAAAPAPSDKVRGMYQ